MAQFMWGQEGYPLAQTSHIESAAQTETVNTSLKQVQRLSASPSEVAPNLYNSDDDGKLVFLFQKKYDAMQVITGNDTSFFDLPTLWIQIQRKWANKCSRLLIWVQCLL